MRGKSLASEAVQTVGLMILLIFLTLMIPSTAEAQACSWPVDGNTPADTYIIIDGTIYEYSTIEKSRERIKAIQEGKAAQEKVVELERKVQLKDEKIALKDDQIAIRDGDIALKNEMIDKLFANGFHEQKKVPLFKHPTFTYIVGLGTAGGLFTLWKFAEKKLEEK